MYRAVRKSYQMVHSSQPKARTNYCSITLLVKMPINAHAKTHARKIYVKANCTQYEHAPLDYEACLLSFSDICGQGHFSACFMDRWFQSAVQNYRYDHVITFLWLLCPSHGGEK